VNTSTTLEYVDTDEEWEEEDNDEEKGASEKEAEASGNAEEASDRAEWASGNTEEACGKEAEASGNVKEASESEEEASGNTEEASGKVEEASSNVKEASSNVKEASESEEEASESEEEASESGVKASETNVQASVSAVNDRDDTNRSNNRKNRRTPLTKTVFEYSPPRTRARTRGSAISAARGLNINVGRLGMPCHRENSRPPKPVRNQLAKEYLKPCEVTPVGDRPGAFDQDQPAVQPYKDLEWRIFTDPITKRTYTVTLVYYDHDVGAIACYRKVLDDNPPHPWDNLPWPVEGENGIASLVHDHQVKRPNERLTVEPEIK
jgi:uncharacterized protein YjbJ (UPF0337 family)